MLRLVKVGKRYGRGRWVLQDVNHTVGMSDLVVGAEAALTCAAMGISIGLLCSRLVIRRPGYALVAAVALVLAVLLLPGLPPVNVLLHLMASARTSAALTGPAPGLLALALGFLVVSSCSAVAGE